MFNPRFHPYGGLFESERAFGRSLLLAGASLTAFAALIFMFPELIAFLFAGFILVAGVGFLLAGIRAHRWENSLAARPRPHADDDPPYTKAPFYRRTFTFILR